MICSNLCVCKQVSQHRSVSNIRPKDLRLRSQVALGEPQAGIETTSHMIDLSVTWTDVTIAFTCSLVV
jgi:hypothetical protein